MTPKIKTYKNGAVVTLDKTPPSGMYCVLLRAPSGEVYDKMRCDDYRTALIFYRAFGDVARGL